MLRDDSESLIISPHLKHVPLDLSSATDLARRSNAGVVASAMRKGGVELGGRAVVLLLNANYHTLHHLIRTYD